MNLGTRIRRQKLIRFGLIASLTMLSGCARSATIPAPSSTMVPANTLPPSTIATDVTLVETPKAIDSARPTVDPPATSAPPTPTIMDLSPAPTLAPAGKVVGAPPEPTSTAVPTARLTSPSPTVIPATLVIARSSSFSNVSARTATDAVAFLRGQLSDYPGSGPSSVMDYSTSDILETMDTIVLDQVRASQGDTALQRIYDVIARAVLVTLVDEYGNQPVVVALDAGHGGKMGFFWDSGSGGTEAVHTRAVVRSILRQAQGPDFARMIVRPIFNDSVADDLGMPARWNRPTINQLLVRQTRAAMLAQEVAQWNSAHPASPYAIHELSIHFNAGAGGALVLTQGDTVRPAFQARSTDFGIKYLRRVIADLNATGLLPTPLRRWGGNGLHDDVMLYRPAYLNGLSLPAGFIPRYGMLQGHGYMPRYIEILLSQTG